MMIKVFLVDDQCLMLEGMRAILQPESAIEIVGVAQDGQAAIAQIPKLQPDIVLLDIEMPKMNGITATQYICQYLPNTQVIVLTSHKNRTYVAQALQAGASGYVLKSSLATDLKQAIYSLSRGYSYIESKLLTQAVNKIQGIKPTKSENKNTYLKRYRKILYTPSTATSQQLNSRLETAENTTLRAINNPSLGINKASLDSIFTPLSPDDLEFTNDDLEFTNPRQTSKSVRAKFRNRKKSYLKHFDRQTILLLIAIASLGLSIIIFS
jgi:DNA-binding NarL/FixJ family response regulator